MKPDWEAFYRNTKETPPSALLVQALESVLRKEKALDLGAGALKDTKFLLQQGFEVTAVDQEPVLTEMAEAVGSARLHAVVSSFEAFDFPEDAYDIANATYALPFNPPETFEAVFRQMKDSLAPGGVFCGQFFGTKDQWNANPRMTFHTKEQVEALLGGLEVIKLAEREWDGRTADGTPKHWHVFDVIARKVVS